MTGHAGSGGGYPRWSPERIAELAGLLAGGLTFVQASQRLGVSKNMAIGVIDRAIKRGDPVIAGLRPSVFMKRRALPPAPVELDLSGCRFSFGDPRAIGGRHAGGFRFCGAPVERLVTASDHVIDAWCSEHLRVVYKTIL